jgi:hypothetical protein
MAAPSAQTAPKSTTLVNIWIASTSCRSGTSGASWLPVSYHSRAIMATRQIEHTTLRQRGRPCAAAP